MNDGYNYPPAKNYDRRHLIAAIVVVVLVIVGAGLALFGVVTKQTHGSIIGKDSGVAACEQMAQKAKDNTKSNSSSSPMTEAQFNETKKPWENSRYTDLKVAGTNVSTTIYDFSKKMASDDADLGTAFAALGTLQAQWGALQVACANHGVTVPPLNMNS